MSALRLTKAERSRILHFRVKNFSDLDRAESQARRYEFVLRIYDAIRARHGEWLTRDEIIAMAGYSDRQIRRWLHTFRLIRYPGVDVEIGHTRQQSRIRYKEIVK